MEYGDRIKQKRENRYMLEKQIELESYLTGLNEEMPLEFFHLAEVIKYKAFELYADTDSGDYFIPYMMNDALEYYFILREASVAGEFLEDKELASAQIVKDQNKYVLILRQEAGSICTVHFKKLEESAQCYQYHQIGHFWIKGQEHWRQLVYMIGTMYDKYEYFGERFCNPEELEILHLIQFAPFRRWSPVGESLDDKYPDSDKGLEVMERLAEQANDSGYQKLLCLYRHFPIRWMSWILSRQLLSVKRQKLYDTIFEKVERASRRYPVRDYGKIKNEEIERKRKYTEQWLLAAGYTGNYPLFQYSAQDSRDGSFKRNAQNNNFVLSMGFIPELKMEASGGLQARKRKERLIKYTRDVFEKGEIRIVAAEEHPFTIMENQDFEFRIRLMVSECKSDFLSGTVQKAMKNAGFFRGKGRRGWIVDVNQIDFSSLCEVKSDSV